MDATAETLTPQAAESAEVETTNGLDDDVADLAAAFGRFVRLFRVDGPAPSSEPWMTAAEAANYARVEEPTIRRWVREGKIEAGRDGRSIRIRASAIDAYLLGGQTSTAARQTPESEQVGGRTLELLHELDEGGASDDG